MKFSLNLPTRPFSAIKNGTKKVEGRVPSESNSKYHQMTASDEIEITNEDSGESLRVIITFKHHYSDVRSMLEVEGVKNVLSSGGSIDDGIKSYNTITGYTENLPKFGIFAIGVKPI